MSAFPPPAPTPDPVPDFPASAPAPGLPIQLTRFVGREREIGEVVRLLGTSRLVTLTGAGGSGKTRLAQEAAAQAAGGFDQVAWVDLAPLTDPAFVPQAVAIALGIHERAGSTKDALLGALCDLRRLVILDNCEHVVDACAELVTAFLTRCPHVVVLATSREALGVQGETAWLVPPLADPEAAQLFAERAQSVLPGFALSDANRAAVSEICRRLDGIPLAIELAAARVRVLSPEQIAQRLDDAFRLLTGGSRTALPRHRTLRGTMEWSHGLLNAREQTLLRRLAVFQGSFDLAAVEATCGGAPLDPGDLLDTLSALVDKSLAIMEAGEGEARYRLQDTVRQYVEERLREAGELEALRARHAAHYVELAKRIGPRLWGGAADASAVERVHADRGNFRAASDWGAEDPSRTELRLRIGTALHWYWFAKGQFQEGRQRLTAALAAPGPVPPKIRARALTALGSIILWQGDHGAIGPPMEEALALLRREDDPLWLAYALNGVGCARLLGGDPAGSLAWYDESLAVLAPRPVHVLQALVNYWRGQAALRLRDFALARAAFEESSRLGRELGHRPALAHSGEMLGRLETAEGELGRAFECLAESIAIHQETEDGWGLARALEGMAGVVVMAGRHERGTRLFAAAEALRERIATPAAPLELQDREPFLARARAALGAGYHDAWREGLLLSRDAAVALALADSAPRTAEYRIPTPLRTPVPAPPAPPALAVQALGPLVVLCNGVPIETSAWGSARPRELLVFLLVHPEGCSKEQVGLAFWPEASGAQVRNSFHVTLHRLRKALGHPEWIGLAGDKYRLDPAVACEFDVTAFEREVVAGLRALKRRAEGAAPALEKALARYRGDFLDGEPAGDWHLEHRDHLRRLYADGLLALGAWQVESERYDRAAETYRRLLARDELIEEAWRQLMLCHAKVGERSQALRLYQRLTELLRREVGAEPDRLTTLLHERIQREGTA